MTTTLGALYDVPAPYPPLERVKELICTSLPPDWRNWTVSVAAIQAHVDKGQRARFAIPSVELVDILAPGVCQISKERCRTLKITLLAWPLGRALIYAPSSLSVVIRGSTERHHLFMRQIKSLRPHLLSRKELNEALATAQSSQIQPSLFTVSETEGGNDSFNYCHHSPKAHSRPQQEATGCGSSTATVKEAEVCGHQGRRRGSTNGLLSQVHHTSGQRQRGPHLTSPRSSAKVSGNDLPRGTEIKAPLLYHFTTGGRITSSSMGEKPLKCEMCAYCSDSKPRLKRQFAVVHLGQQTKNKICDSVASEDIWHQMRSCSPSLESSQTSSAATAMEYRTSLDDDEFRAAEGSVDMSVINSEVQYTSEAESDASDAGVKFL